MRRIAAKLDKPPRRGKNVASEAVADRHLDRGLQPVWVVPVFLEMIRQDGLTPGFAINEKLAAVIIENYDRLMIRGTRLGATTRGSAPTDSVPKPRYEFPNSQLTQSVTSPERHSRIGPSRIPAVAKVCFNEKTPAQGGGGRRTSASLK